MVIGSDGTIVFFFDKICQMLLGYFVFLISFLLFVYTCQFFRHHHRDVEMGQGESDISCRRGGG